MHVRGYKLVFVIGTVLAFAIILAACQPSASPSQTSLPPALACPTAPACVFPPTPTLAPTPTPLAQAPFFSLWSGSPHADVKAEAFNHWNSATPPAVPAACAKCHSSSGFQDFAANGKVSADQPIGSVISCTTCHNASTLAMTSVTFPSGVVIDNLGREAVCMTCHQGRASGKTVDDAITAANLTNPDQPSKDLAFTNIHYFAAAATRYGTQVKGGYEYPGKSYEPLFAHVDNMNTCQDCHDPHTLQIKIDKCQACHTNVKTVDDLKNIRMNSSLVDYNGNGNITEGIWYEVDGLRQMLYKAIQNYAKEVAGTPIVYDESTNPYFFIDKNGNGVADKEELTSVNLYASWTPRLTKAAYNYQISIKDPGGFAHNGKYIIQLLYDSIDDLNSAMTAKVDLGKANRDSPGHFNGSATAFRNWDSTGLVPATCVRCHDAAGLPMYIANGTTIAVPPTDGLACTTCHDSLTKFTRYQVKTVTFPSTLKVAFDAQHLDANLCITCHQGRESGASVAASLSTYKDPDTPSDQISFKNIHYFAAGATLFGTDAKGWFEYPGKKYAGRNMHVENFNTCTDCHDAHSLTVQTDKCKACHGTDNVDNIRMNSKADYNGNGNTTEGVKAEVDGLRDILLNAIYAYAMNVTKKPIVYDPLNYPYYFNDLNENGKLDPEEAKSENAYNSWTPRLLEAGYNYQAATKDPGTFAHNFTYTAQVLYDSIADLNTKAPVEIFAKLVRP